MPGNYQSPTLEVMARSWEVSCMKTLSSMGTMCGRYIRNSVPSAVAMFSTSRMMVFCMGLCTVQNSCTPHNTSHNSAPSRTPAHCTTLHHPEFLHTAHHTTLHHPELLHTAHHTTLHCPELLHTAPSRIPARCTSHNSAPS